MACLRCGADLLTNSGCPNPACPSKAVTPPDFEAAPPPARAPVSAGERIAELEAALRKWGFHRLSCALFSSLRDERRHQLRCTCGLDDVLRPRTIV